MKDNYPVTEGHHLIIPIRHTENFFSMTDVERNDATDLLRVLKNKLEASDSTITGFNIGMNSGESAGQTVMHCHFHLIPSDKQDDKCLEIYDYLIDLSAKLDGVYSAEHGTGKRKRNDFKKCYGEIPIRKIYEHYRCIRFGEIKPYKPNFVSLNI